MEKEINPQTEFFSRYLEATGLKKEDFRAALELSYDHRKFEIELFWKRATYFWAFQAVAFASVGLFLKDGILPTNANIMFVPVLLGALTAAVGWMTSAGSKFWQENWESHVDLLEHQVKARLTATILVREEPRFSVSRLNQGLLACLFFGWIVAFLYLCFRPYLEQLARGWPWMAPGLSALFLAATVGLLCWQCRTRLTGVRHELGANGWVPFGQRKSDKPAIVWRDSVGLKARSGP